MEHTLRLLAAVAITAGLPAYAQSTFATVTGVASDATGAAVPNVAIEARETATNYTYNGCVAKTAETPDWSGVAAGVDYSASDPRVSWRNRTNPTTSPFGNHLTWPFRIM